MKGLRFLNIKLTLYALIFGVVPGCHQLSDQEVDKGLPSFEYDQAAFQEAKPWSSESFKNNPDNLQFAIIGDRGRGANPLRTFKRAMEQPL